MGQVIKAETMSFRDMNVDTDQVFGELRPELRVSGQIAWVKVGETVVPEQLLCLTAAAKEFMICDADAAATMPVVCMALGSGVDGGWIPALFSGYVRSDRLKAANRATGTITIDGDVADGEIVTIGTTVYEFDVAGDGVTASRIDVNSEAAGKAANQTALTAALLANETVVTWSAWATDVITLTAVAEGASGNAIVLTKTGTNIAVSGSGTLTTGIDRGPLYASLSGGYVTETAPSTSGDQVQVVGQLISYEEFIFNPDGYFSEVS